MGRRSLRWIARTKSDAETWKDGTVRGQVTMAWDVRCDCNAGTRGLIVVGKAAVAVVNRVVARFRMVVVICGSQSSGFVSTSWSVGGFRRL